MIYSVLKKNTHYPLPITRYLFNMVPIKKYILRIGLLHVHKYHTTFTCGLYACTIHCHKILQDNGDQGYHKGSQPIKSVTAEYV